MTEGIRQIDNLPEREKRHTKNTHKDRQEGDTPGEGRHDPDMHKKIGRIHEALQLRRRMGRLS